MDDNTLSRCSQLTKRWEGRQDDPLPLVYETVQVKDLGEQVLEKKPRGR